MANMEDVLCIRPAREGDAEEIDRTYRELLIHEDKTVKYTKWKLGVYPTGETAREAIRAGEMYVLEYDGSIYASVILNHTQPGEYAGISWKYPASEREVLVMHTLCVAPSQAGLGLGRMMVLYAKNLARRRGCAVIRLDTGAQNKPAASLYEKQGFEYAGTSQFQLGGAIPNTQIFFEYSLG